MNLFFSQADTKSRLIVLLISIISLMFMITFEQLFLYFILVIILLFGFAVDIKQVIKKLLVPMPIIIGLSFLAFLSNPSNYLELLGTRVSYHNSEYAIFLMARSLLLVLISVIIIDSESSFLQIIYALESLHLPKTLVTIILMMYRFSLDIQQEAKRMLDVRYSRAPNHKWGTSLQTYRILGYIIGAILSRAFIRVETRRDSLLMRGYNGILYHKPIFTNLHGLVFIWSAILFNFMCLLTTNLHIFYLGVVI